MSEEIKQKPVTSDTISDKLQDQTTNTTILLTELIKLIRKMQTPQTKPDNKFSKLLVVGAGIKENWFWAPILAFALAWGWYQFNPLYIFAQFKITSDEVQQQLKQHQYQKRITDHYIQLGDQLLSDGKNKDSVNAYKQAQNIDKFNLFAEYGLLKAQLLDFSADLQFDAVLVKRRLETLKQMTPAGLPIQQDSHILYAEVLLDRKTGVNSRLIKSRLDTLLVVNPDHASALALRADINRELGDYAAAIKDYQRAIILSPYHWNYLNNLAYSYQLSGGQWYSNGQVKPGKKAIEQAFEGYKKLAVLDNQVLAPRIEILRLKLIFARRFTEVNAEISGFINDVNNKGLHKLSKNQSGLNFQWQNLGLNNSVHSYTLNTWLEKQTYLQQLQFLAKVLGDTEKQTGKDITIQAKNWSNLLQAFWSISPEGKLNLPYMLINDIQSIERYNAKWLTNQDSTQQVFIHLKKIANSMN